MSARRYGKFLVEKWRDEEWTQLPYPAQWLYQYLLSQPTTDGAGVFPIRMSKWLKAATDLTVEIIRDAANVLVEGGFLVLDHHTEEGVIRSFIRDDAPGDNIFIGALGCAIQAQSAEIRAVLMDEISGLGRILKDRERGLVGELEASLPSRQTIATTGPTPPATTTHRSGRRSNAVATVSEPGASDTDEERVQDLRVWYGEDSQ